MIKKEIRNKKSTILHNSPIPTQTRVGTNHSHVSSPYLRGWRWVFILERIREEASTPLSSWPYAASYASEGKNALKDVTGSTDTNGIGTVQYHTNFISVFKFRLAERKNVFRVGLEAPDPGKSCASPPPARPSPPHSPETSRRKALSTPRSKGTRRSKGLGAAQDRGRCGQQPTRVPTLRTRPLTPARALLRALPTRHRRRRPSGSFHAKAAPGGEARGG